MTLAVEVAVCGQPNARWFVLGQRTTCTVSGGGIASTGSGRGGRAATLDAGSTSDAAAASGQSTMLELFNKQESKKSLDAERCIEEVVRTYARD
jgi:hypothetical protein